MSHGSEKHYYLLASPLNSKQKVRNLCIKDGVENTL